MSKVDDALKFTYRDYLLLPEGQRYELIEGEFYMVPSPSEPHQRISKRLQHKLMTVLEENDLGFVYDAPFDVVLSPNNVVQPDILFIRKERKGIITESNVQGAPDLVIEILSPSTSEMDLTTKRTLYAKYGVQEYWIVNPQAQSIEVCVFSGRTLETYQVFTGNSDLTSPNYPNLSIDLREIFEPLA